MSKIVKRHISSNHYAYTSSTSYVDKLDYRWYYDDSFYTATDSIYFESTFGVTNASATGYVGLRSVSSTDTIVELSTSSTVYVTLRSADIKASLVDNESYGTKIKSSSASYSCVHYNSMFIVEQSGTLTKTNTIFPLQTDYAHFNSYFHTTGYVRQNYIGHILYEAAVWGDTVSAYFETWLKSTNAGGTAYVTLADTSGNAVTDSELSTSSTTLVRLISGDIIDNLVDGTEYTYNGKISDDTYYCYSYNPSLIIRQSGTDIIKTQCLLGIASIYGSWDDTLQGQVPIIYLYDTDKWDVPYKYTSFESVISSNSASYTEYSNLYNYTDSSVVTGSEVSTTSTSRIRKRTSTNLELTDEKSYLTGLYCGNASGVVYHYNSFLIINTSDQPFSTMKDLIQSGIIAFPR